jgi:hypothetical protein
MLPLIYAQADVGQKRGEVSVREWCHLPGAKVINAPGELVVGLKRASEPREAFLKWSTTHTL